MRSAIHEVSISTGRADALFASALQPSDEPSAQQVDKAIAAAVRAFGACGCAAWVAQEYGERPETAVVRMRWARSAVAGALADASPEPGRRAVPGQRAGSLACRAA